MTRQYIGARYVPQFYENPDTQDATWKSGVVYEPLTMVTYNNATYTSKKLVPQTVGDPAANPSYWVATGNYNGQIAYLQQQIGSLPDLETENKDSLVEAVNEVKNFYVTPQMFGGVGDGVTDDTSAIEAAIATGKNVLFPNGTYIVSTTIEINAPVVFLGCGLSSIIKYTGNGALFNDKTYTKVVFKDLSFEGNTANTFLYGKTTSDLIENCTITEFNYAIDGKVDSTWNGSIECVNTHFLTCGAVYHPDSALTNFPSFKSCRVAGTTSVFYFDLADPSLTIETLLLESCEIYDAILFNSTSGKSYTLFGAVIENSYLEDVTIAPATTSLGGSLALEANWIYSSSNMLLSNDDSNSNAVIYSNNSIFTNDTGSQNVVLGSNSVIKFYAIKKNSNCFRTSGGATLYSNIFSGSDHQIFVRDLYRDNMDFNGAQKVFAPLSLLPPDSDRQISPSGSKTISLEFDSAYTTYLLIVHRIDTSATSALYLVNQDHQPLIGGENTTYISVSMSGSDLTIQNGSSGYMTWYLIRTSF